MTDTSAVSPTEEAWSAALQKYVYGQAIDVLLTLVPVFSSPFGNDITRAMVFFAAARGSVGHLNHHNRVRPDADGGVFPDALRRPVSILSVSDYLGLPYETTRRHMHALVADGWCERVGARGFLVRSATMQKPSMSDMAATSSSVMAEYVTRLAPVIGGMPKGSGRRLEGWPDGMTGAAPPSGLSGDEAVGPG